MRLYLSSYGFGNKPEEFVRLIGDNKRVALIANSVDYRDPLERKEGVDRNIESIKELGLIAEEIDLRNYFNIENKEEKLREELLKYGAVWIRGGNTFLLMRAFRQSGFEKVIKELLSEDKILYGGYSAGVCILAPTLEGLDIVDQPRQISEGYNPEAIWEGLAILSYTVSPHYKSDHPESADVDKEVAYMEKHNLPYKTLRDGEVIVIEGEKETFYEIE